MLPATLKNPDVEGKKTSFTSVVMLAILGLTCILGLLDNNPTAITPLYTLPNMQIQKTSGTSLNMAKANVKNDAYTRQLRSARKAGADDRVVELKKPMGLELDEDEDGNVYVKAITKGGRADKSGVVFVGDRVAMVSATFGEDLWNSRGVGLTRVLSTIKVRNTKPVTMVLEATNEADEKKRRAIAFAEASEAEKKAAQQKQDELLKMMQEDDKQLRKKGGFWG